MASFRLLVCFLVLSCALCADLSLGIEETSKGVLKVLPEKDWDISRRASGVSATKDVKKGEVLLSISSADIISVQAAVESPLAQSLQNVTLSPTILLGLFVLHEKNNAESKWKSYLDSLPTEFLTPIYFSAEELKELEGSSTLPVITKRLEMINQDFYKLQSVFKEVKNPFPEGVFTLQNFAWAMSVVWSRMFLTGGNGNYLPMIIPFTDKFNHFYDPEYVNIGFNVESQTYEVYAPKDTAVGEEIFLNNGDKSNDQLFINYGIIQPVRSRTIVPITVSLSSDDPFRETKRTILNRFKISESETFYLAIQAGRPIVPQKMVVALRIHLLNFEEINLYHAVANGPISLRNELQVVKSIVSTCESLLGLYTTTFDADTNLLNNPESALTRNQELAIQYRRLEKIVLISSIEWAKANWLRFLSDSFSPPPPAGTTIPPRMEVKVDAIGNLMG